MLNKIKNIFITLFHCHCITMKFKTTYKPQNFKISLFILLIGIGSYFIRYYLYENLKGFPALLFICELICIAYLIYLNFNTGVRFIFVFFKGIPFFIREWHARNITFYLTYYIVYNLTLTLTGLLVIYKVYSFLNSILNTYMFIKLFYLSIIVSLVLLILYIKSNFKKYTYILDESKLSEYTPINFLLFIALPITMFVNINHLPSLSKILCFIFKIETIHCDSEDLYKNKVIEYYNKESFWNNLFLLEHYSKQNLLSESYLNSRRDLLISKLLKTSKFNQMISGLGKIENKHLFFNGILFNNLPYYQFYGYPVLFNNCYEVAVSEWTKDCFASVIFKHSGSTSLLSLLDYLKQIKNNTIIDGNSLKEIQDKTLTLLKGSTLFRDDRLYLEYNSYDIFKYFFYKSLADGVIIPRIPFTLTKLFNFEVLYIDYTYNILNQSHRVRDFFLFDSFYQLYLLSKTKRDQALDIWRSFIESSDWRKLTLADPELLLLYNNQNNIAFNRENLRFIADRFILIENLSTTDNQQDNTIINKDQTKIIRKSIIRLHSEYHISNLIMYLLKKIFN